MSSELKKYCLDANVLIQAWQKYYSPRFCMSYWEMLNELGKLGRIFLPEEVFKEITRTEDDLSEWLTRSSISVMGIDEGVTECLRAIYGKHPSHQMLVDNIKGRSLADPWVIAHALHQGATVVTKEERVTALNSTKIKIPNVCDNMGVDCIDDFKFIAEVNLQFSCQFG